MAKSAVIGLVSYKPGANYSISSYLRRGFVGVGLAAAGRMAIYWPV